MVIVSLVIIFIISYTLFALYCKLTCGINKCSKHLVGKVVIVTGGNAGIGFETAKDLAARGARVILACRDETRGTRARDYIAAATDNNDVHFQHLNLASIKSGRAFADGILRKEKRLDILINNGGIMGSKYEKTEDGLPLDMQTNHFGPFLHTSLLLPLLISTAPSRIINLSSMVYRFGEIDFNNMNCEKGDYSYRKAYSNSKLCNVLMTVELAKRLQGTGVTTNCVHSGAVMTEIIKENGTMNCVIKYLFGFVTKTPWEGAQTSIYFAVTTEVDDVSGKYFADCRIKPTSKIGNNADLAHRLWQFSERIVKI